MVTYIATLLGLAQSIESQSLTMMTWIMQDLFARLVVLLHNPLARGQLATQILTVCLLTDLK
jgi:hypothetical protein